jgi:hypothetical protein
MSDSKQVALIPYADFTIKDLETIEKFKEDGMLGLHTLKDTDVERMMALYIDGQTYRQIANMTQKGKPVVLYLANKFKWFEMRKEYLDELQATLREKVIEAKLQDQEFLLRLSLAYKKKIRKNIDKYLTTDNEEFYDKIDNKDLATLMKVIELTQRLNNENIGNPNNDKSLVGLNGLGEGVTITRTGGNSVEITPKASAFKSKLKEFADSKREMEREAYAPKVVHDITSETLTENKQESEKEDE